MIFILRLIVTTNININLSVKLGIENLETKFSSSSSLSQYHQILDQILACLEQVHYFKLSNSEIFQNSDDLSQNFIEIIKNSMLSNLLFLSSMTKAKFSAARGVKETMNDECCSKFHRISDLLFCEENSLIDLFENKNKQEILIALDAIYFLFI